ncbi:MAG: hypothetical protein ACI8RD_006200 [Bacillariaceae sp.]|jgi:hypothetical protein
MINANIGSIQLYGQRDQERILKRRFQLSTLFLTSTLLFISPFSVVGSKARNKETTNSTDHFVP